MSFDQWLAANGYDAEKLTDQQRKHLEAAWKAETQPAPLPAPAPVQAPSPGGDATFAQKMAEIERENQRISYIREATVAACERHRGDTEKIKQLRDLCQSATEDEKMDARAYDLALLRVDRMLGPMVLTPKPASLTSEVLEAAVCLTEKIPTPEKHFSPQTLDAAHKNFRHGIGLKQLLMVAAERNGYRGDHRNLKALLRAAFSDGTAEGYGMMAVGPSTITIPGILSNVANKFLRVAFEAVESSWRQVAAIRSAQDFKTMTSYSLTGDLTYEQVAPGGEIKHGTLGETSYTNKVDTYAKLIGLDRRDIINDDLGALTSVGRRLGRGGALKLNDVFWTEFLADAGTFYTAARGNFDDGAVDSLLSLAGLENADNLFRLQTDPDGKPLGSMPRILLVPTSLRITALNLMNSTQIVGQGEDSPTVPANNPWAGAFIVVSSVYLTQTALGGSSLAWYLLADPADLPVIEIAFLNGMEMPTIEEAEMDFDRLGIAMRGYHDFGANKQEYRAAVKLKGEA